MIGVPIGANSVYVSTVQTGCCRAEFDSTYPVHLNGIISQHEFQESINKINQAFSSNRILLILGIGYGLSMFIGMICFMFGGISAAHSYTYGFPPLIAAGMAIIMVGSLIFIIGCIVIQLRRLSQIRQAVAEESMKYSSRPSTPCSWRLETTRYWGEYGNQNSGYTAYHLVIDIGRSTVPGAGGYYPAAVAPETMSYSGQQNNYAPPPYQTAGFCPQCGGSRSDLTARFCSSCGHSFNKQ